MERFHCPDSALRNTQETREMAKSEENIILVRVSESSQIGFGSDSVLLALINMTNYPVSCE